MGLLNFANRCFDNQFYGMRLDYLIVGQGVCGTFLSYYLQKENKSFIVIDKNDSITPSKVSAGIINPVTGRRMVRVWMAEKILSFAHDAYSDLGNFLGIHAITQKNIIDFFPNPHQRQVFMERIEEGEQYLHSFPEQNQFNSFFNYDLGCGEIRNSYVAHLETLLPAWKQQLKDNDQLLQENFKFAKLVFKEDCVHYKNIIAEKIIFCDGLSSFENPFFKQLPFAPNKGEMLIVEIPGLANHFIYKKGFLLAPLQDPGIFWMGSNYQWSFSNAEPTKEFFEQAERHLKAWLKLPFKTLDHKAAIRPATLERRPFVGIHPHQKNVAILNGMGTKGCSLAPFFAFQLKENLVYGKEIEPLSDVSRFKKILSAEK